MGCKQVINFSALKGNIPESVYEELFDTATRFQLNSPLRIAHFIAQCSHESMGFSRKEENLNYSAERLLQVFPKYFNPDQAKLYARNPVIIASRVYANRMGNREEDSGDGYRYRGRGYIQLTGHDNYKAFDLAVSDDVVGNPDFVAMKYPLFSAGWFWNSRKLNDLADLSADQQVVADITKKINGGYHGLEDRVNQFNKFYGLVK